MYNNFRPGKTWYDTDGKRIQAHGGSILYVNDVFYWYGENKEGITGRATGEKCKNWHNGVRLYSSKDLYNWKDEGIIMSEKNDVNHPFYSTNIMDRPHIVYNEKTKLFVLWAKTINRDGANFLDAIFSVCVSESITKPFRLIKQVQYKNFHAGDFDLVKKGDKAYIIYENPHTEIVCQTLSEDFTDLTDEVSSHMFEKCPPFVREAPAFFEHNGRKFLLTSGTTGYYPNPSRFDEIKSMHGEWSTMGNACKNDLLNNSFHAQFSSVFKHPKIDGLYIALGDRWLNDIVIGMPDINKVFQGLYDDDAEPIVSEEDLALFSDENTSEANYVWLPILFDKNGNPYIEWKNEWKTEDFLK